ncbi:adenylyltransferase/cytidyltransferase family protein [Thermodesulfovibrionales bacterium]|nr:adenylyltransferase/cytidyltransferase family protein [Thermodesulfovibrionales bacterium]
MKKILSRDELKKEIDTIKAAGRQTVFTNGCFDIIHIGHIRCLREAKKSGEVLIIGLNSDSSVRRLKPLSLRPIIPETQRAEVIASLEMVDYVTIFSEDTPYELIKYLGPDVLVKGGDWKRADIVGADIVPEVYSLPYIHGISTTEIVKKIRETQDTFI